MVDTTGNQKKTEMSYIQRAWRYVMTEPFTWLFYAFFQPVRFKREYESKGIIHRMSAMLRLVLPIFLCTYPLALLVDVLRDLLSGNLNFLLIENLLTGSQVQFLFIIALTIIVGIMWSVLWGVAGGIAGGIAWGIILSI